MLGEEPIGEAENPAYVHKLQREWRHELGQNPEDHPLQRAMFRDSVMKGLPGPVRSRLEDVIGLSTMEYTLFCEHVTLAMEKHRNQEQRMKENDKSEMRKRTHQQLTAGKKRVQGAVGAPAVASKEAQDRAMIQEALQV